jgi:hypothetical protein
LGVPLGYLLGVPRVMVECLGAPRLCIVFLSCVELHVDGRLIRLSLE